MVTDKVLGFQEDQSSPRYTEGFPEPAQERAALLCRLWRWIPVVLMVSNMVRAPCHPEPAQARQAPHNSLGPNGSGRPA
jgi:hypothetical protein